MNVTKLYLLNVCMPLEFWKIDNVHRPHDSFIIYGKLYCWQLTVASWQL